MKQRWTFCRNRNVLGDLHYYVCSHGQHDAVYAATCVNAIKIPNFDKGDSTFKALLDSDIERDNFTSM